ncbi:hypothetical protein BGX38DRAFT_1206109, partial [Terfezia claveryi]
MMESQRFVMSTTEKSSLRSYLKLRGLVMSLVDNRPATNNEQNQQGIKTLAAEGILKGILDPEINQMLPRVSVLPGTGPLFSSKITLDAIINTVKGADSDILDVLLVGDDNGRILV